MKTKTETNYKNIKKLNFTLQGEISSSNVIKSGQARPNQVSSLMGKLKILK